MKKMIFMLLLLPIMAQAQFSIREVLDTVPYKNPFDPGTEDYEIAKSYKQVITHQYVYWGDKRLCKVFCVKFGDMGYYIYPEYNDLFVSYTTEKTHHYGYDFSGYKIDIGKYDSVAYSVPETFRYLTATFDIYYFNKEKTGVYFIGKDPDSSHWHTDISGRKYKTEVITWSQVIHGKHYLVSLSIENTMDDHNKVSKW